MKKQLFALLGLGLLLATASAYAQTVNAKANVPFNFVVTGGTLPNGEYTLRSVEGIDHAIAISDERQKSSIFLATPCLSLNAMQAPEQAKLVFNHYGDQYFLSEIWMQGSTVGYKLPKTRREVEIAQNETAQQVVVLAELH
jgi:hypothetical protein